METGIGPETFHPPARLSAEPRWRGLKQADLILLRRGRVLARRDPHLPFDQVEPGDRLRRPGCSTWQPCVHLEEEHLLRHRIDQELDGAQIVIRNGASELQGVVGAAPRGPRPADSAQAPSSSSFWLERCTEQSRSKRWTILPCRSPATCTSTWRGRVTNFSISRRPSPKAACASPARGRDGGVEIGFRLRPCGYPCRRHRPRP